jgi:hypothetical protein
VQDNLPDAPKAIDRTLLFDDAKIGVVIVILLRSIDPVVKVMVEAAVNVLFNSNVQLTLLIVSVETLAATLTVITNAEAPELESIVAVSADVGTLAPPAPPEVADHLAVSFQLPVPPTQNLAAICASR